MVAACGSNPPAGGVIPSQPPTANLKPLSEVTVGEGELDLIAREGYVDDMWAKSFVVDTGCKINVHYAGTPAEIANLMKDGGGGKWDLVTASGEISLSLMYGGDVKPVNTELIPAWKNFQASFKSPSFNTVRGIHYGISSQWSPDLLLYNTKKYPNPPTSWDVIYDPANQGIITVPDNPIQIADAALYLSKARPALAITDPFELTPAQFQGALSLLKDQHALVRQYWTIPSDEIALFQTFSVFVGSGWPYQTMTLQSLGVPVADAVPTQGATAWADSWMLATRGLHPNCAYLWMRYVSEPKIQAEQALLVGETPVNSRACAELEAAQAGSCARLHADAQASYFDVIRFWKTPLVTCADGTQRCVPYDQWVSAWAAVKGG